MSEIGDLASTIIFSEMPGIAESALMKYPVNGHSAWFKSNFVYIGSIAFAALYYWFVIHTGDVMQQRGKYTVGFITGWTQTLKSGRSITYRCIVNGIPYTSSNLEKKGMNSKIEMCYLVEYDSLNPSLNYAYFGHPLSPDFGPPPVTGWTKKRFRIYEDSLTKSR